MRSPFQWLRIIARRSRERDGFNTATDEEAVPRDAWEQIREASAEYREVILRVERLSANTPGAKRIPAQIDQRPDEWRLLADDILLGEIGVPTASDHVRERVANG